MTIRRTLGVGVFPLVVALVLAAGAWAGAPTDRLREGIDGVFKIVRDPAMAGDAHAAKRRDAVFAAASALFDFPEMARLTLGPHWTARTQDEQAEFVALFAELIQHSYLTRVDQVGAGPMAYTGETIDGDRAEVRTTVPLPDGSSVPVIYRMHNGAGRWRVYDVAFGGISLVSSYRAQFTKIIRVGSFETLVARLKEREAENARATAER
jgi:phospholipid transport system substrate-binding protein